MNKQMRNLNREMENEEKKSIKKIMKKTKERYSLKGYINNTNLTISQKIRYCVMLNAFDLYCFGMKVIRK